LAWPSPDSKDQVTCGPGDKDKAKVDKEDDVSGCEKVKVKK
jgi:hypothetical protein